MTEGFKKNGVKALFVVLGIAGIVLMKNSENSGQVNTNILAGCYDSGCPDSGLETPAPRTPKGPRVPVYIPKVPKG